MIHKVTVNRPSLLKDIKDTKIVFDNLERFDKEIQSFKDGTELYLDITDKKPPFSKEMRSFLHVCFDRIAKEGQQYTSGQIKCLIKKASGLCIAFKNKKTGELEIEYKSTEGLDKVKYCELIDLTLQYAAQEGVYILDPGEYLNEKNYNEFKEYLKLKKY